MNVSQVLDIYNEERPNQAKEETKMRWLKAIESMILRDVILTHALPKEITEKEDFDRETFAETYFDEWGMDFELYIPEEFVMVYVQYLNQENCRIENEMEQYNVAAAMFNNAYIAYQDFYNRTHYPVQHRPKYFDHARENY